MSSDVWTASEQGNLALIQAVKRHPCLYNNTLPEYSQKDVTNAAWQEIAQQFGCSVFACKRKWNNFRSALARELRKQRKKPNREIEWSYAKPLSFLLPFTQPYLKLHLILNNLNEEHKETIVGIPFVTDNDSTHNEPLKKPHVQSNEANSFQKWLSVANSSSCAIKHQPNQATFQKQINEKTNKNAQESKETSLVLSYATDNNSITCSKPREESPVQFNTVNSLRKLLPKRDSSTIGNYSLLQIPQLFVIQSEATGKIAELSGNNSQHSFNKSSQIVKNSVSKDNDLNKLTVNPTIVQCVKKSDNEGASNKYTNYDDSGLGNLRCRRQFIFSLMPEVDLMTETQFFSFKRKLFELIDSLSES